ncbi:hypothetical protein GCM10009820_18930 [Leifsonia soli]
MRGRGGESRRVERGPESRRVAEDVVRLHVREAVSGEARERAAERVLSDVVADAVQLDAETHAP